jgi:hypothetical protein
VTGNDSRQRFLDFFHARGHRVVRSSSLVSANDPTLLFTNAGMNQFKEVLQGLESFADSRRTRGRDPAYMSANDAITVRLAHPAVRAADHFFLKFRVGACVQRCQFAGSVW